LLEYLMLPIDRPRTDGNTVGLNAADTEMVAASHKPHPKPVESMSLAKVDPNGVSRNVQIFYFQENGMEFESYYLR